MTQNQQLNPFELKQYVMNFLSKVNSSSTVEDFSDSINFLDSQENKTLLVKILLKELENVEDKAPIIFYLLPKYMQMDVLIEHLWDILKEKDLNLKTKVTIINFIRDHDSNWSYQQCEKMLGDATEILDENTKQLLDNSVLNPEVQIDFMDFFMTISPNDRTALLDTFGDDFTSDGLASVLAPVFISNPNSSEGKLALEKLEQIKSPVTLRALLFAQKFIKDAQLNKQVKKIISTLKLSGIRENTVKDFYKEALSDSVPAKCYVTDPDGVGNMAIIILREIPKTEKVRYISFVANVDEGIKDSLGFFEISRFESEKILERFFKNAGGVNVSPAVGVALLNYFEEFNNFDFPYEYVCWKNLLLDIEPETDCIEKVLEDKLTEGKSLKNILDFYYNSCKYWYLDEENFLNFRECLNKLNKSCNLDEILEKDLKNVFDSEQDISWKKRLTLRAYIALVEKQKKVANDFYTILENETLRYNFYNEIFKRSLFEYLYAIKYDKKRNIYDIPYEVIVKHLKYIEETW